MEGCSVAIVAMVAVFGNSEVVFLHPWYSKDSGEITFYCFPSHAPLRKYVHNSDIFTTVPLVISVSHFILTPQKLTRERLSWRVQIKATDSAASNLTGCFIFVFYPGCCASLGSGERHVLRVLGVSLLHAQNKPKRAPITPLSRIVWCHLSSAGWIWWFCTSSVKG